MGVKDRLDLAELDAETAHLHLVVDAAQELETAVAAPAHQVAGAVDALARHGKLVERVGQELLGSEVVAPSVTLGEAGAADQQFTGDPDGDLADLCVDNVQGRVEEAMPQRRHLPRLREAAQTRPDSGLGGPVHVPEFGAARDQGVGQRRWQRLAAAEDQQVGLALPTLVDEHPPCGWGRLHDADLVGLQ